MTHSKRRFRWKRWPGRLIRELNFSVVCAPCTYGDTRTFLSGERQANLAKSGWKQLGLAPHGVHGATGMQAVHEFREVGVFWRLPHFIVENNRIVSDKNAPVATRDRIKNEL
jgi:hypothetical protein